MTLINGVIFVIKKTGVPWGVAARLQRFQRHGQGLTPSQETTAKKKKEKKTALTFPGIFLINF